MGAYAVLYKEKRRREREARKPAWLEVLLRSTFFLACGEHAELRKGEKNIYCIDCCADMCPHCLNSAAGRQHAWHRLLQIRRYVYQDVVRLHDMHKLLDCSGVQPYIVNGAKVVLLNARKPSGKPPRPNTTGASCKICRRSIFEPNRFCSIACKISEEPDDESAMWYQPPPPPVQEPAPNPEAAAPAPNPEASAPAPAPAPAPNEGEGGPTSSSRPTSDRGEGRRRRRTHGAPTPKVTDHRRKKLPRRSPFF